MNLFFVNLDGVRVLGVDDEVAIPEVHIELERLVAGCPTCGVVARVQGRSPVRLIDLVHGRAKDRPRVEQATFHLPRVGVREDHLD